MKTNMKLWSYIAQFFLEWECFKYLRENQNKLFMHNNIFPKTVFFVR